MPRGNLETIYPRALVLSTVRRAINNLDYKTAFLLCRKHRIDMNLLVDHNRDQFTANVEKFVMDVEDPEYLNLFISGLRDEDVTITMYYGNDKTKLGQNEASPTGKERMKLGKVQGKINTICTTLCDSLQSIDPKKYIYPILTTDTKKTPPDLTKAMSRILEIKKSSLSPVGNETRRPEQPDSGNRCVFITSQEAYQPLDSGACLNVQ